jgi:hypothetical protein
MALSLPITSVASASLDKGSYLKITGPDRRAQLDVRAFSDVRLWHKADITTALPNVRFWG